MKYLRILLAVTLMALTISTAAGCSHKPKVVDLGGGSLSYSENAEFEDVVNMIPTREGYAFAGWYADAAFAEAIHPASITKNQQEKARAFARWARIAPADYDVRTYEATVTASGRKDQALDPVYFAGEFSLDALRKAGYTHFQVQVTMELREVDDGYQHIYLYSTDQLPDDSFSLDSFFDKYVMGEDQSDPNLLYEYRFEHGGPVLDTEWGHMSFTATIPTDRLDSNLYLRYNASGADADTWMNRQVKVTITPVQ